MKAGQPVGRDLQLPYDTDAGLGARAHIGFIVFSTDQTLSWEARQMLAVPGVAIYESRQGSGSSPGSALTTDLLSSEVGGIAGAAELINARRAPDVVAYGCTSAAMVMGREMIANKVREVLPNAKTTNPLAGVLAALKALRCRSLALVSPYPQALSDDMANYLENHGYKVPVVGRFHHETDTTVAAPFITAESIMHAILETGRPDSVDAVFVSCTQMRCAEILGDAEQELGKPVVSSNQALCWHALRLAGCQDKLDGWGSLFTLDLADPKSSEIG